MEIDRNGLEVLGREECLRLLSTVQLGRIAVTSGALPTILPVNFRADGDRVLVRTGEGTKLEAATRNAVVAFEVDEFDTLCRTGWSVTVTGVARRLIQPDELARAEAMPLRRWAPLDGHAVIAISTDFVSGRRIGDRTTP